MHPYSWRNTDSKVLRKRKKSREIEEQSIIQKHPGGKIVYGQSPYIDTKSELFFGKYFGWDWNIIVLKDIRKDK